MWRELQINHYGASNGAQIRVGMRVDERELPGLQASVPRPVPRIRSARSASPADERGGPLHSQPVVVSGQES